MNQYTVSDDRGKALIGLKGTRDDRIEMAPGACLAFVATWPLPAFLLAGFRSGYKIRRSQIVVKVNLFSSSTASIRKGIEAEAERLSHLFEKKVLLEYESVS